MIFPHFEHVFAQIDYILHSVRRMCRNVPIRWTMRPTFNCYMCADDNTYSTTAKHNSSNLSIEFGSPPTVPSGSVVTTAWKCGNESAAAVRCSRSYFRTPIISRKGTPAHRQKMCGYSPTLHANTLLSSRRFLCSQQRNCRCAPVPSGMHVSAINVSRKTYITYIMYPRVFEFVFEFVFVSMWSWYLQRTIYAVAFHCVCVESHCRLCALGAMMRTLNECTNVDTLEVSKFHASMQRKEAFKCTCGFHFIRKVHRQR